MDARSGVGETPDRSEGGATCAHLSWGVCSDKGPARDHNEDFAGAHLTEPDGQRQIGPLFAIADGMGGHAAGQVASRTAVESLLAHWTSAPVAAGAPVLRAATRAANTAVFDASFAPGQHGMGTTMTAAAFGGHEVVIAHVGDTRAYLVRDDRCTQVTTDHSRVAEMVRMKLITAEQAKHHPARSQLTRSLGGDPIVQVDVVHQETRKDDALVLCSDGVWEVVSMAEVATEVSRLGADGAVTPRDVATALVDAAIQRETADNVTVLVVQVTSAESILPVPQRRSLFRRTRS